MNEHVVPIVPHTRTTSRGNFGRRAVVLARGMGPVGTSSPGRPHRVAPNSRFDGSSFVHPQARRPSPRVLNGHVPSRFRAGLPVPAVGHSGALLRHGLRILPPSAPLVAGGPRAEPPDQQFALRANLGHQQWKAPQRFPGALLPPADVPGVYRLKANSSGTSWRGRALPFGRRPLRGLTGCPPDAPGPT